MNLQQLRKKFVELSGNYHMVTDTQSYNDDGADFHIQGGQRFIENLLDMPRTSVRKVVTVEADQERAALPRGRYVRAVFIRYEAEQDWRRLTQMPYREYEQHVNAGRLGKGKPAYWATPKAFEVEYETTDPQTGNPETTYDLGVDLFLHPAPDQEAELRVEGSFRTLELEENEDENFWSRQYPGLLIQAAMYDVEKFYRNRAGMRDHLEAIQRQIQGMDDNIAQQAAEYSQEMNVSW